MCLVVTDEFKPASIDKNQPGKLHKTSDNKVAVEFQNNQPGKPKVSFEGSSEDYKDNDAVLFFDGESFRLERLHRSVKRLRHVRQPGESAGVAAAVGVSGLQPEASSPPLGKGSKVQSSNKNFVPATVCYFFSSLSDLDFTNFTKRIRKSHNLADKTCWGVGTFRLLLGASLMLHASVRIFFFFFSPGI